MIAEALILVFLLMFVLCGLGASKEMSGLVIAIALSFVTSIPFIFWFIIYIIFMCALRIKFGGGLQRIN